MVVTDRAFVADEYFLHRALYQRVACIQNLLPQDARYTQYRRQHFNAEHLFKQQRNEMHAVNNLKVSGLPAQVSEATIRISNLRLRTFIGFNPEEKSKQQDIVVNAEIRYRADQAFISDSEADALNYKTITKQMIRHVESGKFQLLEKLVADLLTIATDCEEVSFAEVKVDKPNALRFADSVSVTLSATR
jgi:D-erythro-7,8-dihydroneopterin triphosphate epimerase